MLKAIARMDRDVMKQLKSSTSLAAKREVVLSAQRVIGLIALMGVFASSSLAAISVHEVTKSPTGNLVVTARYEGDLKGTPRLYFRRAGYGDYYFVAMRISAQGTLTAVLPKSDAATDQVECYASIHDSLGRALEKTDLSTFALAGAKVEGLTPEQQTAATSIAIGETTKSQKGRQLAWFKTDGISSRMGVSEPPSTAHSSSSQSSNDTKSRTASKGGKVQFLPQPPIIIGPPGDPKEVSIPRP